MVQRFGDYRRNYYLCTNNIVELLNLKIMKDKESKDNFVVQNLHLKHINIEELIYEVRGQNVMIDSDLAMICEEETKYLKRAVRAHIKRFPDDFMFELTKEEYAALRCKNSTINKRGGNRYPPYAFTNVYTILPQLVWHVCL